MPRTDLPTIQLLALGGTIACAQTPNGLKPGRPAAQLLEALGEPLAAGVEPRDPLERTVVFPEDWVLLSHEIQREQVGALSAGEMTNEMALVRLMWALGNATTQEEARTLFQEQI